MSLESNTQKVMVIGFGRRFAATIVDGFFVLFLSFAIALFVVILGMMFGFADVENTAWNQVILFIVLFLSMFYYVGMWSRSSGQTFGKVLLGIQVVSKDGELLTFGKAFLRYLGYLLSGIPASLGFIWVGFDKKRRGWHDMVAGTYVISVRDDMPKEGEIIFERSDEGKGWVWVVLWVILAIASPVTLFSSLWFLGPVINNFIKNLFSGLG